MTEQQQIDTLQKQLDAANEQIANIDNALKEQYANTATGIIDHIESWFQDQRDRGIALSYDDIYKFLDNYRNVIEATAPKYTPSVLCQLSMALSEARRQLAEQRIQHEVDKRILKEMLNSIYGVKRSGKLPKSLEMHYVEDVVDYALRQEQVKQAKLEVLHELKDMLNDKPDGFAYIIYIDDMIKEVQNGEDKS